MFILHHSTPQTSSLGHRKTKGQDPKIWEKRIQRICRCPRSFSIPSLPMVDSKSPLLSLASTRAKDSGILLHSLNILEIFPLSPLPQRGCLEDGLAKAALLRFVCALMPGMLPSIRSWGGGARSGGARFLSSSCSAPFLSSLTPDLNRFHAVINLCK